MNQTNGVVEAKAQELDNREGASRRTGIPFDREYCEARGLAQNLEVAESALSNALALLGPAGEDRANIAHALQLVTHRHRKATQELRRLGLVKAGQEELGL